MQSNNANKNAEWDAVLGDNTATGTLRLVSLILLFVVIGGSVFYFLG
jgi:hypothetical protein